MAEEAIQKIILEEIRAVKDTQIYQGKQLTSIELRLGIIEHDCKALTNRVDNLNGCTGELASELDELTSIEECKSRTKRSRKEKLYMACKVIGAICAIAGIIVAICL